MENFSFQVFFDTVQNFKGTLPTNFETPQKLWEHIKSKSQIETFELEELEFDVTFDSWSKKVTIEEIVKDPLEDVFKISFE